MRPSGLGTAAIAHTVYKLWKPRRLTTLRAYTACCSDQKTKLRGLSPQAKYTDRATAACRRSYCQPLRIEDASVSVTDLYGRIFGFLDRSRYFFFLVAPQLCSRG
jgi:hypothetical protein